VRDSKERNKNRIKSNYTEFYLKQKLIEFCPKWLVVSCARNYCAGPAEVCFRAGSPYTLVLWFISLI
jgi:hypothetical protein